MDTRHRPQAAPDVDQATTSLDVRAILRTVSARRGLIALITAIVLGAVGLYSVTATPYYRANLRILIERDSERIVSFQEIYNLGTGATDYYVTQYKILESRAVTEAALARLPAADRAWFEAKPDPVRTFAELRQVRPVPDSRLVDVQTEHPDPEVATRTAQALVDAYIDNVRARRASASNSALGKLRDEAEELQHALRRARKAVQEFKTRNNIVSVGDRQHLVAARLEKLSEELAEVERARSIAESRLSSAEQPVAEASYRRDLPEVLESTVVASHKRELLQAREELFALSETYKSKHPQVQALARRVEAIEAQLQHEIDSIHRGIRRAYERHVRHETDVRRRIDEQTAKMLELEKKAIEHRILEDEANNTRRLYDAILARLKEVEIINDHDATNVHAIGSPEVSHRPVRPRIVLNLLLALVGGVVIACGVAFAVETCDRSIKTPAEASRILEAQVLGMVPRVSGKHAAGIGVHPETLDHRSALSEAFRTIRTAFTFSDTGRDVRSVVVTSATPEEGKSLVSISFAISMARAGKKVLLIDADMRRPRLHHAFGVDKPEGLAQLLAGDRRKSVRITRTAEPNLFLLPCGAIPENPVELLTGAADTLALLRRKFDLVVIDSPPVGAVSDACVLSTMADKVLFVVRSAATDRSLCQRAMQQLQRVGASIAGIVLNHTDAVADRYGRHQYGHGYGAADVETRAPSRG